MPPEAQFQELRPLLFSLAYRMLGTRADAEDIVQEAWLRWQAAAKEEIRLPKSFLTTVVARLSLDALKAAHRKREAYVGPWLPEPLIKAGPAVEPAGTRALEMAELLSMAFLHMLESLSPAERAAFLLREAFEAPYEEIATVLETSEENSRQLVARARKHIDSRKQRFQVDRARHRQMLERFLEACASGDPSRITEMLTEDAVLYADGGGKALAAINPIYTADHVARFLTGVERKVGAGIRVQFVDVNGEPGVLLTEIDGTRTVIAIETAEDGRMARLFFVRNPDKIAAIESADSV